MLLVLLLLTPGCYLSHVAGGQLRLLRARQPMERLLADPATPAPLRERLELVRRAREFARDLGLEVSGQYTSYAPWPGDRVVTTVVAARPGELSPAGFWFPLLGTLPYKGYFDPERAEAEAARLAGRGLDVCVTPVRAYSTLGWFDDPITGPMLRQPPGWLVETLVHELVHATVYRGDAVDFDEGVATFIGEEASVRFYAEAGESVAAEERRAAVRDARLLRAALLDVRERVAALYAEAPPGEARERQRGAITAELRTGLAALPLATRDPAPLAAELRLNDACLALVATYAADSARYEARLAALGGDLRAFVARLREVAEAEDPREALLAP